MLILEKKYPNSSIRIYKYNNDDYSLNIWIDKKIVINKSYKLYDELMEDYKDYIGLMNDYFSNKAKELRNILK